MRKYGICNSSPFYTLLFPMDTNSNSQLYGKKVCMYVSKYLCNYLAWHSCPKYVNKSNFDDHWTYHISSYSFRGNYSFLNLEIQGSQYIRPKVTVHKGAETIQGRKLFKGGDLYITELFH